MKRWLLTTVTLLLTAALFGCTGVTYDGQSSAGQTTSTYLQDENSSVTIVVGEITSEQYDDYYSSLQEAQQYKTTIVAEVNGQPIYRSEVEIYKANMNLMYAQNLNLITDEAEREAYLQACYLSDEKVREILIKEEVVAQEMDKAGYVVDASAVKEQEEAIFEQSYALDPELYSNMLDAYGYTREEYIDQIAVPVGIKLAKEAAFLGDQQFASQEEREAYYEEKVAQIIDNYEIVRY